MAHVPDVENSIPCPLMPVRLTRAHTRDAQCTVEVCGLIKSLFLFKKYLFVNHYGFTGSCRNRKGRAMRPPGPHNRSHIQTECVCLREFLLLQETGDHDRDCTDPPMALGGPDVLAASGESRPPAVVLLEGSARPRLLASIFHV